MQESIYLESWYQNASVRTKGPFSLCTDSPLQFFPEELQPICQHPIIDEADSSVKTYFLTQICYKYLQEVCITETDVVNPTSLNIAYGFVPVQLTDEVKANAFSIITDEAFHSYVARTLMNKIIKFTNIDPIIIPKENEVTKAIANIKKTLSADLHSDFELVATCISENVFTDEIIAISRFANVNPSFHQIMKEHARDEGRHAIYFINIMKEYWSQIDENKKSIFAVIIPQFIEYCMDGVHDHEFLTNLLKKMSDLGKLKPNQIDILLHDNYSNKITQENGSARINNMLKFLEKSGALNYSPLAQAIAKYRN